MLKQIAAVLIAVGVHGYAVAGIMVQPQGPLTPGTTVIFDLIVKNETISDGGMGPFVWTDAENEPIDGSPLVGQGFSSIGGLEFMEPGGGVTFADVSGLSGLGGIVPRTDLGWSIFPGFLNVPNYTLAAPALSPPIVLYPDPAPGGQISEFKIGELHLMIDANFTGPFTLQFERTPDLFAPGGNSVTSKPPSDSPTNPWLNDANPPVGKNDSLGSHGPVSFVFFVPEPSPFLLLGLVTCLMGVRKYWKKQLQFIG